MIFFLEYVDGAILADFIGLKMREPHIAYVIHGVTSALRYMHACYRVHRRVNVSNIVLGMRGVVKLSDFAAGAQLNQKKPNRNDCVGVPAFCAPEMLKEEEVKF